MAKEKRIPQAIYFLLFNSVKNKFQMEKNKMKTTEKDAVLDARGNSKSISLKLSTEVDKLYPPLW